MKIKMDFVTNSSSASFYIMLDRIDANQVRMIYNHIELSNVFYKGPENLYNSPNNAWKITQDDKKIMGDTSMDNFDILWFLKEIGISGDIIHYDHS